MSNHEIRCRGCGADLRREGESHEANCLASKLGDALAAWEVTKGNEQGYRNAFEACEKQRLELLGRLSELESRSRIAQETR